MIALSNTVSVAAVAAFMVVVGLRQRMLDRREVRTCPSCGREIRTCRCC